MYLFINNRHQPVVFHVKIFSFYKSVKCLYSFKVKKIFPRFSPSTLSDCTRFQELWNFPRALKSISICSSSVRRAKTHDVERPSSSCSGTFGHFINMGTHCGWKCLGICLSEWSGKRHFTKSIDCFSDKMSSNRF